MRSRVEEDKKREEAAVAIQRHARGIAGRKAYYERRPKEGGSSRHIDARWHTAVGASRARRRRRRRATAVRRVTRDELTCSLTSVSSC